LGGSRGEKANAPSTSDVLEHVEGDDGVETARENLGMPLSHLSQ
jgi:hypothetical protein